MLLGLINLLGTLLLLGLFVILVIVVGGLILMTIGIIVITINYFTGVLENLSKKFGDIFDKLL